MADLAEIVSKHADVFTEGNDIHDRFGAIQTQLQGLGYDVLINDKAAAEFVPSSRLSDVVSQRDTIKSQLEEANRQLTEIRNQKGTTPEVQATIDALTQAQDNLLKELQESKINLAIVTEAEDAINPQDIVMFVDRSKIKMDKDGKITAGLSEEIERIRTEKPYFFKKGAAASKKAGTDGSGGGSGGEKVTMNAMIRGAASRQN